MTNFSWIQAKKIYVCQILYKFFFIFANFFVFAIKKLKASSIMQIPIVQKVSMSMEYDERREAAFDKLKEW